MSVKFIFLIKNLLFQKHNMFYKSQAQGTVDIWDQYNLIRGNNEFEIFLCYFFLPLAKQQCSVSFKCRHLRFNNIHLLGISSHIFMWKWITHCSSRNLVSLNSLISLCIVSSSRLTASAYSTFHLRKGTTCKWNLKWSNTNNLFSK